MRFPLQGISEPRKRRSIRAYVIPAVVVLGLIAIIMVLPRGCGRSLPDFGAIENTNERKEAFFAFLHPFVDEANTAVLKDRERLLTVRDHLEAGRVSKRDTRWVKHLAEDYDIEVEEEAEVTAGLLDRLLSRVDIIPPSLALSQAALESGWGTSRFAQKGHNLFGIWCYEPGCGIVPKRRPAGQSYEVKAYPTPEQSFADYMRNLNTNRAYESLWQLRRTARENDRELTGVYLADGLYRYSQEGWTYVGKVQNMIRSNDLLTYDEKYH